MSKRSVRAKAPPRTAVIPPRPPALPEGGGLSFARALWRLTSASVSSGNKVALCADGDSTFNSMIGLIEGARERVVLESYIFKSDSVGQRFSSALVAAAKRGVQVHVLTDWVGRWGTRMSFFRAMRREGVDVRIFNPPGFHRWFGLVPRDHRKVLVADGRSAMTGGIGIGDEWQRRGILRRESKPWRDTCVRITGPAARDFEAAFGRMWARAAGERPSRAERRLNRVPRDAHLDPVHSERTVVGIVEGEPGRLRTGRALHIQSAAAQRSIWLASAYFAPSFAEIDALAGAARDGVDVRLLVPSVYDHPWLHSLTRRFYARLLRNGVRIWEWRGSMMHAKTTVVDGRWIRVGSTDFNPLGVAINFELDAMIEDPTIGAEAEAMFEEDLTHSTEITRSSSV